MESFITDFLKVYNNLVDAYNAKILETINDKYRIIDRAMIASYLYIKMLDKLNLRSPKTDASLINYLMKQVIYGETGNLSLDITDTVAKKSFKEVSDKLIAEKFSYLNRILTNLKYNYQQNPIETEELFTILERIAEYFLMQKLALHGNREAKNYCETLKDKLLELKSPSSSKISEEINQIIDSIANNELICNEYANLVDVALNLKDVYRYSNLISVINENVLFHQYVIAIMSIIFGEYLNLVNGENIDIASLVYKALFHDFPEYKGNEIVTQIRNYNEDTIKMFKMIESADELDLKAKLGDSIFDIIVHFGDEKEGYISELLDKMIAIIKIWFEVEFLSNSTYIKVTSTIYQSRFKRFGDMDRLEGINNKDFFINLLRTCYIVIKNNLMNKNPEIFSMYFTDAEKRKFEAELKLLREEKDAFLA